MSGSALDKYISRSTESQPQAKEESDVPDDLGSFGFLRGSRDRTPMLELRKKDGAIVALGYAWLERAEFDPSEGITLSFGDRQVKITGCHLNSEIRPNVRLFAGILRHRVSWICEADAATLLAKPSGVVLIDDIEISS
jgi:hypothetical protein